jgi:hypothetical protein
MFRKKKENVYEKDIIEYFKNLGFPLLFIFKNQTIKVYKAEIFEKEGVIVLDANATFQAKLSIETL